ncbi:tyrosine-type recombinase/integrase [Alicyclobacillus dauci]|uniref:Phage integrase SAM-like domain-containing protein n=1 Tax=Alicyclobacillus dauci TaxID=1475485 RepID=A0ABY6YYJ6_9BACL|nr:phage integrase SAM-like domain-containing protein [Alicyclobacillus dauci]WAH35196.1 phage integrase SAM-like domain-containing protein [Alicyclobacillus dauci]
MEQRYVEFKEKFSLDNSPSSILMRDFMDYLDSAYGDQKREIATRTKYVYQFLESGDISAKLQWSIDDVAELEAFRQHLSVQKKTAMYHFVKFIEQRSNLRDEIEELKIKNKVLEIPECFQGTVQRYLEVLKSRRKMKHWTRYQLAFAFKYFFDFVHNTLNIKDIRQIDQDCIVHYLQYLKSGGGAQKYVYTRFRELNSLFTWAYKQRLIFANPCKDIEVQHYYQLTAPLTIAEQEELVKRWMSDECDPREAIIGILALIYGCSAEEIRFLKLEAFINEITIHIEGRPTNIVLNPVVCPVLERYLLWREQLCKGADVEYLIVSRESYKTKKPLEARVIFKILSNCGQSLRRLRATMLLDAASTGNIKLLEAVGLSFEGTRPYMRAATPVLWMGKPSR